MKSNTQPKIVKDDLPIKKPPQKQWIDKRAANQKEPKYLLPKEEDCSNRATD